MLDSFIMSYLSHSQCVSAIVGGNFFKTYSSKCRIENKSGEIK